MISRPRRSQIQALRGSQTPDRQSQTGLERANCDLLRILYYSLVVVILAGCVVGQVQPSSFNSTPSPPKTTLTVFAAASLTDAFTEIGRNFEADHAGVTVAFNFAGSQQLAQQLSQGAPADVFASANESQMTVVKAIGRVVEDSERPFAYNRLVVIYPAHNPAGLSQFQDLAMPGVRLVLAAAEAPVGSVHMHAGTNAIAVAARSPGNDTQEMPLARRIVA